MRRAKDKRRAARILFGNKLELFGTSFIACMESFVSGAGSVAEAFRVLERELTGTMTMLASEEMGKQLAQSAALMESIRAGVR